jgi:hypothetical protein
VHNLHLCIIYICTFVHHLHMYICTSSTLLPLSHKHTPHNLGVIKCRFGPWNLGIDRRTVNCVVQSKRYFATTVNLTYTDHWRLRANLCTVTTEWSIHTQPRHRKSAYVRTDIFAAFFEACKSSLIVTHSWKKCSVQTICCPIGPVQTKGLRLRPNRTTGPASSSR